MLVLSRKEAEKVLFPSLGITVEISRVLGKNVRLGIDAPQEIRIIREELADTADLEVIQTKRGFSGSGDASRDLQKCLDAANLAIHLAQNQLRQRLNDNAEEALENALVCLVKLENAVASQTGLAPTQTPVREAKTGYRCNQKKVALVVCSNEPLHVDIENRLTELGYQIAIVDCGEAMIRFLQENDQPSLVLTVDSISASSDEGDDPMVQSPVSGLRMFGVGSLQKTYRAFEFGDSKFTGWYADSVDAQAMASCFG